MSDDEYRKILDAIAEKNNVEVSDEVPAKPKMEDKMKKIFVVLILVAIYGVLMAGLFITKNLIFLILIVAYVFLCKPMLKLLMKVFKIKPKSDTQ